MSPQEFVEAYSWQQYTNPTGEAKVLATMNNKGGVTKTTTTANLGYALARHGIRTLLIDADGQCNLTYAVLGDSAICFDYNSDLYTQDTIYEVIVGVDGKPNKRRSLDEPGLIIPVPDHENLYFVRGSLELNSADLALATVAGRENALLYALEPIRKHFDVIIVDNAPTLGIVPVNAAIAADAYDGGLLMTISPQVFAILGIKGMNIALEQLRKNLKRKFPIFGVVCARQKNTRNANDWLGAVKQFYTEEMFETVIPENEKVEENNDSLNDIFLNDPNSTGAIAYWRLAKEFIERAGLSKKVRITSKVGLHMEEVLAADDKRKLLKTQKEAV